MYENNVEGSVWSGLASGVPGDLRGLEYLHNKYGVGSTSAPRMSSADILSHYLGEQCVILLYMLREMDFQVSHRSLNAE